MLKKLGPHILEGGSTDCANWVRAGAPIVKLAYGWGFAEEAARLPHRPLVIGRVIADAVIDPNKGFAEGRNPEEWARWYVGAHVAGDMARAPSIAYWESPNEPVITEAATMDFYARFLAEFARVLRVEYGKAAVLGNWSVGRPHYPLWLEYGPALDACRRYNAILGRHSYSGPDRSTWEYLSLRHRVDNQYFSSIGFPNMPVALTEFGADSVPFGNPPGKPWKELYGDGEQAAQRYLDEILLPLDAELAKDSYVLGATVFTGAGNWPRHNIDGWVAQKLTELASPVTPPVETWPKRLKTRPAVIGWNMRRKPDPASPSVAWARPGVLWTALSGVGGFYELPGGLWISKNAVEVLS